jgi:predicted ribosomally synthesized peptide with SipW-like signal peptide
MDMAISRKALTVGTMGVAALALIGTGAGASFTDAVHATQSIHAGTMNLQVSGPGTVSNDGKSITLDAFGPTGSTFESTKQVVTITNNGDIAATADAIQMTVAASGNANDIALFNQTNVCIQSTDYSGGPWTEGNGPLSAAVALNPTVKQNAVVLDPGDTMTFSVTYYAGQDSANCRPVSSDGSHTSAAWDGYLGHPYQTPASLTNAAQGGTITPTMTFSFTG